MFKRKFREFPGVKCFTSRAAAAGGAGGPGTRILHAALCDKKKKKRDFATRMHSIHSNNNCVSVLQYRMVPSKPLEAQTVKNLPTMPETWVRPPSWEDLLEEGMTTHSSILAWRIPMDTGAWRATVQGVSKSRIGAAKHTEAHWESAHRWGSGVVGSRIPPWIQEIHRCSSTLYKMA